MKNPIKDEKDSYRVNRGGSWGVIPVSVRASSRDYGDPAIRYYDLGFRLVKNIPKERNEKSNKR